MVIERSHARLSGMILEFAARIAMADPGSTADG
jgi:hypothetical protein